MRILVTGGSGNVGKAVIERLAQHGNTVRVLGRTSGKVFDGAEYALCDILDYERLCALTAGFDAVVHLAAIPNPFRAGADQVFLSNAQGTFNVFRACEEAGIRRVMSASSINALGVLYGRKIAPIHYLPVDEVHPCYSTDAYSFGKHVVEDIGDYYWRRSGISSVSMRLPWVVPSVYHDEKRHLPWREHIQQICEDLLALDEDERRAWYQENLDRYQALRAAGMHETQGMYQKVADENPDWREKGLFVFNHRMNFFTFLDERDSAQAIEKSLTAEFDGSHVLFVNDDQNWTGLPSRTLAALFYPEVGLESNHLEGAKSLVSVDKAKKLIGFNVEYSYGD